MTSRVSGGVRTPPAVPAVVSGLSVVNASSSSLQLTWQPLEGIQKGLHLLICVKIEIRMSSNHRSLLQKSPIKEKIFYKRDLSF